MIGGQPASPSVALEKDEQPTIFIVDDDDSFRIALEDLISAFGLKTQSFASTQEFILSHRNDSPGCLVLDVRMPGQSGLDFHRQMAKSGFQLPVIFITGHGDIPMSVRAMKAGAIEFLTKPLCEQDLLAAIQQALEKDCEQRRNAIVVAGLQARLNSLTWRERQVLELVACGLVNKQIAAELDLSLITVKVHRGHVMKKMQAKSLTELVRLADQLGVPSGRQH